MTARCESCNTWIARLTVALVFATILGVTAGMIKIPKHGTQTAQQTPAAQR